MDWQRLITLQPTLAKIPETLKKLAEERNVDKGETLYRVGDQVRWMFSVISCELRLIRRNRNGMEIILQRSRSGFFGEASLTGGTYHCDVVVAEKGMLLQFPASAFRMALEESAEFRNAWIAHLAREVRRLRAQAERLCLRTTAERILHYIESEGVNNTLVLRQSRKAWAVELGLTHEALYRALRKMQADETLSIDGNQITLGQNN